MRDISDIALKTLMTYISQETSIVTGNIFFQFPDDDFINERTKEGKTHPFIGLYEGDHSKIEKMNYGCTYISDTVNADGTYTVYTPLGKKMFMVQLDIFCETQAQRRIFRTLIENALLRATSLSTSLGGDPVPNEVIRVNLMETNLSKDKPYIASLWIDIEAYMFREEDSYLVDVIEITTTISEGLAITGSASGSVDFTIVIDASGVYLSGGN